MKRSCSRPRSAVACVATSLLLLLEGCATTIHVARTDYPTMAGKGRVEITTREGRVYNFRRVAVDSSRFLGQVDVVRSVVTRDGHIDAIETTEPVQLPFDQVVAVDLKKSDIPGSALALGAGAGLVAALIRAFGGATTPTPTGGGGGGDPDNKAPRHR